MVRGDLLIADDDHLWRQSIVFFELFNFVDKLLVALSVLIVFILLSSNLEANALGKSIVDTGSFYTDALT